ncbi:hypothetical protein NDU88_010641, partial [Pleurodeles waltl]
RDAFQRHSHRRRERWTFEALSHPSEPLLALLAVCARSRMTLCRSPLRCRTARCPQHHEISPNIE